MLFPFDSLLSCHRLLYILSFCKTRTVVIFSLWRSENLLHVVFPLLPSPSNSISLSSLLGLCVLFNRFSCKRMTKRQKGIYEAKENVSKACKKMKTRTRTKVTSQSVVLEKKRKERRGRNKEQGKRSQSRIQTIIHGGNEQYLPFFESDPLAFSSSEVDR